jgi:hypothetical protein
MVNENSDVILLNSEGGEEAYRKPAPRGIAEISSFIPSWMSLPLIETITKRMKATPSAAISTTGSPPGKGGSEGGGGGGGVGIGSGTLSTKGSIISSGTITE